MLRIIFLVLSFFMIQACVVSGPIRASGTLVVDREDLPKLKEVLNHKFGEFVDVKISNAKCKKYKCDIDFEITQKKNVVIEVNYNQAEEDSAFN